jgi:tetrapyrrole methylase family protein / MazG family protein
MEAIMPSLTTLSSIFSVLGLDTLSGIFLMEATALSKLHVPPFSPEVPALIVGIESREIAAEMKAMLYTVYPVDYRVRLLCACGTENQTVEEIPLKEIDLLVQSSKVNALFVPPLPQGTAFEQFQEIVAHLRAPDGCPWDKEQTHLTLRKHLIEESYEMLDALDTGNPDKMREEFGDLLLQIVLNAQIASEYGEFNMTDVIKGIHDKIVRRHPHVFGDVVVDGVGNVLLNWEKIKATERESNGDLETGLLDGLPAALPALTQAQEYQDRASRVGFDWPEIEGVLDKIDEEIEEVRRANDEDELTTEIGDLFFALVNLARWKKIDAESALRNTNRKFKNRFSYIEQGSRKMARSVHDLSLDEMETLWQEAKKKIG